LDGVDWAGRDASAAPGTSGQIDDGRYFAANGMFESNGPRVTAITADSAGDTGARQAPRINAGY